MKRRNNLEVCRRNRFSKESSQIAKAIQFLELEQILEMN